jgi:hypothetical protein
MATMKITMEVDCTPVEARQFFGLPDVQPMQAALLAEMERNIMQEVQRYSPDALMKLWFASGPEWFKGLFESMQKATQVR